MNIAIIGYANCPHYIRALNKLKSASLNVFPQEVGSSKEIDHTCLHICSHRKHLQGWRSSTSPQIIVYNRQYEWCIGGEDNLISIGCNLLKTSFENKIERLEEAAQEVGAAQEVEAAYYKLFCVAE